MTDLLGAETPDIKAIHAHADKLPKTLEPDTARDMVLDHGEGDHEVAFSFADLLATAHLLAGKPTVTDWNGQGAEAITAKLEAAKPILQASILAGPADAGERRSPEGAPSTEAQAPDPSKPDAKDAYALDLDSSPPTAPEVTPPKDEAPEDEDAVDNGPQPATGVIPVFVLADGKLGEHGRVVRVSRRKLADLGLVQGKDWEVPTAAQLAIGL